MYGLIVGSSWTCKTCVVRSFAVSTGLVIWLKPSFSPTYSGGAKSPLSGFCRSELSPVTSTTVSSFSLDFSLSSLLMDSLGATSDRCTETLSVSLRANPGRWLAMMSEVGAAGYANSAVASCRTSWVVLECNRVGMLSEMMSCCRVARRPPSKIERRQLIGATYSHFYVVFVTGII